MVLAGNKAKRLSSVNHKTKQFIIIICRLSDMFVLLSLPWDFDINNILYLEIVLGRFSFSCYDSHESIISRSDICIELAGMF